MAGITGRAPYGYPYGSYPGAPVQQMPGYQMQGYGWPGMQQQMQQTGQASQMSKPTVHADIIQVENEAAGEKEPVDAGTSQMMITKDESAILIKSVLANGETTMVIYRKVPPEEKPETEYVTRAEFEHWVAEMIRREKIKTPIREAGPAEEDPEDETVPRTRSRKTEGAKRA